MGEIKCFRCGRETPDSLRSPTDPVLYADPSPRIDGPLPSNELLDEAEAREMLRRINDLSVFEDEAIRHFQEEGTACSCLGLVKID